MSKEDKNVPPFREKLFSIGKGIAGIVDRRGFAFEVSGGESNGDVFVSVGRFGPMGTVETEDQVFLDFPSVVNGGGKHPYTSLALDNLRETIVNHGQKPLSPSERIIETGFTAELITVNGNELRIDFTPFYRPCPNLTVHAIDCHWVGGKRAHNWVSLFEGESQREFAGVISAFRHLAEAIQRDGGGALLL